MDRARDSDSKRNVIPGGKHQQNAYQSRRRKALDLLHRMKPYDMWVNERLRTDADKALYIAVVRACLDEAESPSPRSITWSSRCGLIGVEY
jgi:hypothetical protein